MSTNLHTFARKNVKIGGTTMAIAIKTIPVLTGETAERFVELAEASRGYATTFIPKETHEAIRRMMQRSKDVKVKLPRQAKNRQ